MTGLALARRFFDEAVGPTFRREAPEIIDRLAFGLVGAGSECYGFDDEISRDHDWGPRVCVWVPDELYDAERGRLERIYAALPRTFLGFGPVERLDSGAYRDGPVAVGAFFRSFLGSDTPPVGAREWLLIPEWSLSACTNGEVFVDQEGTVTHRRAALAAYFPDDVWRKKSASCLKRAGQHGQYNYQRALHRDAASTAAWHRISFARECAAALHLARRVYRPIDKWLFRSLRDLGRHGEQLARTVDAIVQNAWNDPATDLAEEMAAIILEAFAAAGLDGAVSAAGPRHFLYDAGLAIEGGITEEWLRTGIGAVE